MSDAYDVIVIGGGAGGAPVARRLVDGGARVLLLEAGAMDTQDDIHDIAGFVRLWGSDVDWGVQTEPQAGAADRQIMINQGKVLGGSGSINAMMYVRGNPLDYDGWAAAGADGWSYDEVLPYFRRSENYEGGESDYHGVGGPLSIRDCPNQPARSPAFAAAAVEAGFDGPNWDYNGRRQEDGAGLLQFHIDTDGRRCSPVDAFLRPILDNDNLTVETGALASRLLLEGGTCTGVEYIQGGETHTAHAAKVVVSCGSFFSPALLMRSGIGPAAHLREHGIDVAVDLPGVGANLQDHLQLPCVFRSKVDQETPKLLTGNVLFTRTRDNMQKASPDLQLNFTPSAPGPLRPVLPDFGGPVCIFLPILVQPQSIGSVRLRSADPAALPIVDPRYLDCDVDAQALVHAVELVRRIAATDAFSDHNALELAPGPDADLEAFARANCSTLWHPAGTCKMGLDAMAVVDPQLRVYGVENLYVSDASVMPRVTAGNTFAPAVMIGERAAEFVG